MIEISPSNRTFCFVCKNKIEKNKKRITLYQGHNGVLAYFHSVCFLEQLKRETDYFAQLILDELK